MPRIKGNDKVWRYLRQGICQDCMQRVDGNPKEHTCKRLDEFPQRSVAEAVSRPRDFIHKQPLV